LRRETSSPSQSRINTAIDLGTEREENLRAGKFLLGLLRLNSNFVFDRLYRFRTNGDKLDAHSHAPEAVANLASSLDYNPGSCEPEAQFQNRTLGIFIAGVDEHAMWAKVRRPNANVLLEAFIYH
jgi:hypothetical protein